MKFHSRIATGVLLLLLAGALGFFTVLPGEVARLNNPVAAPPPYPVSAAAASLHRHLFVTDLHADSLLWGRDLLSRSRSGHVDVPRLRPVLHRGCRGWVNAQGQISSASPGLSPPRSGR